MSTATVSTTPDRSLEQRRAALDRANAIRVQRAALKRDLKTGQITCSEILAEPPRYVASMKVYDLLMGTPKLGRVKAGNLLADVRIAPGKTVGGVSSRQRTQLGDALRRRGM